MLMRFDPFRELDRLTQQTTTGLRTPAMPMDAYRHGEQFVIHFDVPGVDPSTIELTVEKNVLTVSAERTWQPAEGDQVVIAERPQGRLSRQLFLGEGLDPERIEANSDNGVLTVTVPVAERAKPRKVSVGTTGGGRSAAIDASSSEGSSGETASA
jgi:HSP20 family protein